MKTEEILNLTFYCDDLNRELTIREYFNELLKTLWEQKEGFIGKRPFGNSGWYYEIFDCLVKNGVIEGIVDDDGYVEDYDSKFADTFVLNNIIKPLFLNQ